jgi:uncharacterized protein YbaR (Trm112 family)
MTDELLLCPHCNHLEVLFIFHKGNFEKEGEHICTGCRKKFRVRVTAFVEII